MLKRKTWDWMMKLWKVMNLMSKQWLAKETNSNQCKKSRERRKKCIFVWIRTISVQFDNYSLSSPLEWSHYCGLSSKVSILVHSCAIPVHSCSIPVDSWPFLWIPVPFLWTPVDSSGMGSFLQESVGHDEVLPYHTIIPNLSQGVWGPLSKI